MTRGEKIGVSIALLWLVWRARPTTRAQATSSPRKPPPPVVKPKPVARIYKGPNDAYETVRMSVETPGMPAREMGIFDSRAKAEEVAKGYGWAIAP